MRRAAAKNWRRKGKDRAWGCLGLLSMRPNRGGSVPASTSNAATSSRRCPITSDLQRHLRMGSHVPRGAKAVLMWCNVLAVCGACRGFSHRMSLCRSVKDSELMKILSALFLVSMIGCSTGASRAPQVGDDESGDVAAVQDSGMGDVRKAEPSTSTKPAEPTTPKTSTDAGVLPDMADSGAPVPKATPPKETIDAGKTVETSDPVTVTTGTRIAVARNVSCWLREDGAVYCWGGNNWKHFGAGEVNGPGEDWKHASPVLTQYKGIGSIGLSRWNSYGVTEDGQVWGAGQVSFGVLSKELKVSNPAASPTLLNTPSTPKNITDFAASYQVGCALAAGRVYCQGRNSHGNIGDGTVEDRLDFVDIGLSDATDIVAGYYHTCVVSSGKVMCWGDNSYQQIGIENPAELVPSPAVVALPADAVEVSAGSFHTCARTGAGEVYCWGRNWNKMITNDCGNPCRPTKRAGLSGVTQLATSGGSTCVLLENSTVNCWGGEYSGLGKLTGVKQIASGHESGHFCALVDDGGKFLTPYCWGASDQGQLGRGSFTPVDPKTPAPIELPR